MFDTHATGSSSDADATTRNTGTSTGTGTGTSTGTGTGTGTSADDSPGTDGSAGDLLTEALAEWLADTLEGVDVLAVLTFAARALRAEAADGRRSSGDDVLGLTEAIEVATAAQVLALGRFDAAGTWADGTARTALTWIHRATDAPRPQLARLLAAGRVTHDHDEFADALAAGTTSVGHIAALGRVATKQRATLLERDAEVLATLATDTPLQPYERALAHWAGWADDELADDDTDRAERDRSLSLARTFGGWHLKGFLPTEDGELLRKLLAQLTDPPDRVDRPNRRTPSQRRADAFGTLLRRHARRRTTPVPDDPTEDSGTATADDSTPGTDRDHGHGRRHDGAGNDTTNRTGSDGLHDATAPHRDADHDDDHDTRPDTQPDLDLDLDTDVGDGDGDGDGRSAWDDLADDWDDPTPSWCCAGCDDHEPRQRTDDNPSRPPPSGPLVTVDVRVDLAHLLSVVDRDRRPPEEPVDERLLRAAAALPDLVPWSRGELERLLCDSWIGRVLVDGTSLPLDLGRRTRTFSGAQRRAISVAHPTCVLCDQPVDDCDLHHMAEWDQDHGPTDLANGIPLCPPDHRWLHLLGLRLTRDTDLSVTIEDRSGRVVARTTAA